MLGGISLSKRCLAVSSLGQVAHGFKHGIFAITSRNTLASLNPDNGEITWRQIFDADEPIKALKLRDGQALTLSGTNKTHVRVWDADSGSLAWEFFQPADANYRNGSGTAEFLVGSKDVVAVAGDSFSTPVWELALNATGTYKRIVVENKVALPTKKNPKAKLQVIEVDLKTGTIVRKYQVASDQTLDNNRLVVLESKEYGSYVVWREEKNIVWQIHRLGMTDPEWEMYHAKIVQTELMPPDMLTSTLHEIDTDPGLNADRPRFAMNYIKDGKAKTVVVEMYRTGDKLEMRKIVDDAVIAGSGVSVSAKSSDNQSERAVLAVRTAGDTPTHTGEFVYDKGMYGPVTSASLYYTNGELRVLVQTSGALWFRDESLAHATDMLPAPVSSAEYVAKATDPSVLSSPVTRYILRWSAASWVASGFGAFDLFSGANSSDPASRSVAESLAPKTPITVGDHFGFHKLSIFALSTKEGSRSWTRFLTDNGTPVAVENVFPLSDSPPLVTVVGRNADGNSLVVVLNALTGELIDENAFNLMPFSHVKVFELPAVDPQLLGFVSYASEAQPQLNIWPSTADTANAFCSISDPVFFDLGDNAGSTQLSGFPDLSELLAWTTGSAFAASKQWDFELPNAETLISATGYNGAQSTALLGRVLGDRSVLYKYLNPHLVTLATRLSEAGGLAYTLSTACLAIFCTRPSTRRGRSQRSSRSWRSKLKIASSTNSGRRASPRLPAPPFAQSLHITTRDVLFGLASSKLLGLPDQMFDPRRPKRAPTKDEQAEGLIPYAAPLPLDPKRVLSHYNTVAGITHIKSAPTHLESTSLVASFGLDLFFTRTSPSGTFDQLSPSFSKVNLVVTTLLWRKLTNQAWA
ncbi:hypothetical protein BX661DRAFT_180963 [Kickxella alabastrina]|uniref:uncharacterized protein n=1 Tax=Kickxella alabastrina TaxID=61397 RepID=UPI002220F4E4|nr:uncharacterized protein BX661DRAFT_180963 [Kickxella alabastrina]KAI7830029.1 hypothetical protein BX661DRAFT_180963 [Kickxella alabastrina]